MEYVVETKAGDYASASSGEYATAESWVAEAVVVSKAVVEAVNRKESISTIA